MNNANSEYLLKNVKLKIDEEIFQIINLKRKAFVLFAMLNCYFEKNSDKVAVSSLDFRKFKYGNWSIGEEKYFSKSTFYQSLKDLQKMKLISFENERIKLLRKLHEKGKRYFSVDDQEMVKQFGMINPRQIYFQLLNMFLLKANPPKEKPKIKKSESRHSDIRYGEVWVKEKRIFKKWEFKVSFSYFLKKNFSYSAIWRHFNCKIFKSFKSKAFKVFKILKNLTRHGKDLFTTETVFYVETLKVKTL